MNQKWGLAFIRGRFIVILKKTSYSETAGKVSAPHATDDYETLRRFTVGGNEIHDCIATELARFILHGTAAWLQPDVGWHNGIQKAAKPFNRYFAGNLTVLLANIIES